MTAIAAFSSPARTDADGIAHILTPLLDCALDLAIDSPDRSVDVRRQAFVADERNPAVPIDVPVPEAGG